MAGCNDCGIETKGRVIKKMQAHIRVGRQRALKFVAGEDESLISNPHSYPTHFRCKIDPDNKRKFSPRAIEKSFIRKIGSKPATIRSNNESEFVIEISNKKESKILPAIKSFCFPQYQGRVEVEMFACNKI